MGHVFSYGLQQLLKKYLESGKYYEPVGKTPGKPNSSSGMSEICGDEDPAYRLWESTEKELNGLEAL